MITDYSLLRQPLFCQLIKRLCRDTDFHSMPRRGVDIRGDIFKWHAAASIFARISQADRHHVVMPLHFIGNISLRLIIYILLMPWSHALLQFERCVTIDGLFRHMNCLPFANAGNFWWLQRSWRQTMISMAPSGALAKDGRAWLIDDVFVINATAISLITACNGRAALMLEKREASRNKAIGIIKAIYDYQSAIISGEDKRLSFRNERKSIFSFAFAATSMRHQ